MNITQSLIWIVLPYSSLAILVMGYIWRYENQEDKREKDFYKNLVFIGIVVFATITGLLTYFHLNSYGQVVEWITGLIMFNPNIERFEATSALFKIHVIALCSVVMFLPFTKYVRVITLMLNKKAIAIPILFLLQI